MKLKKLLKVIPERYRVGITDSGGEVSFIAYGTKEDAVKEYAVRMLATTDEIEDLEVDTVIPCARVFCTDGHVFNDVMPPLHIEPQLYIEVRAKGV